MNRAHHDHRRVEQAEAPSSSAGQSFPGISHSFIENPLRIWMNERTAMRSSESTNQPLSSRRELGNGGLG